jgi:flagellar hook-length control protein FliK
VTPSAATSSVPAQTGAAAAPTFTPGSTQTTGSPSSRATPGSTTQSAAPAVSALKADDASPEADDTDVAATSADAGVAAAASLGNAASQAVSAHPATAPSDAQPLHATVGTDAWSNELGARVTLMAQQGVTAASLRLSPAHLGPVEVRISVRDDSASVWFGAAQPDTRTALEQALPRLRELFAQQGLNLSNSGVSGETPRGTQQQAPALATRTDVARETAAMPVTSDRAPRGLVDTYA